MGKGRGKVLTNRQVRFWFQKLEPSSRAKSTPPIGAPKAAATPAAAPAETKSRFSLKIGVKLVVNEGRDDHYNMFQ